MAPKPGSADPLARYNEKRNFGKTTEPAGRRAAKSGNRFVVQKHAASRLHWDFRLEIDGVLKSWAVTRGPSSDPGEKRLAVRTEDHPLDYAAFEGTIPAGEYGGGTVMLWDHGSWAPIPGKTADTLDEGHLHFTLDGTRMRGEWLLIRLKPRPRERGENWLLRKIDDDAAGATDDLVERALTSVTTGRTMEQIAAGVAAPRPKRAAGKARPPAFRAPQLATLVDAVPAGNRWLHEVKYDGYRALVAIGGGNAKVFTRSGLDWTAKFPGIAAAAAALTPDAALLDAEIVALDAAGRPSFSALQAAITAGGDGLVAFAFDLLEHRGDDLAALPNIERKARLAALLGAGGGGVIHYAEHIVGAGEKLFEQMCAGGYEGIVSKQLDAPYRSKRTAAWVKVKCTRRQEFVVIGWTGSTTKARPFGALLLALHEDGALRYAGRVGTGFDAAKLGDLAARLAKLAADTPAAPVPRAAARGVRWVRPELVAEVAFAEFTGENVVRHASFIGLRGDRPATAVAAETAVPPPAVAAAVKISNPDRVIFPGDGLTKGDLAAYYEGVAGLMLPWSARRPISLVRCPQGRAKHCFFQKHDAGSFGEHVEQVDIREKDGSVEPYLWLSDTDGLLQCVQMGTIEFHGWGSKIDAVEQPDRLVFDLDPDEAIDFAAVKQAAVDIKQHLADLGLTSFPLLSGGKGLHVVVPLTPDAQWPVVKDFARRFSLALAQAEPERFIATMSKAARKGLIFIDWLRNQRGATAIMPYAARARPGAPVAAPVGWRELADIDAPNRFTIRDLAELRERAASRALAGWGLADQRLPDS